MYLEFCAVAGEATRFEERVNVAGEIGGREESAAERKKGRGKDGYSSKAPQLTDSLSQMTPVAVVEISDDGFSRRCDREP